MTRTAVESYWRQFRASLPDQSGPRNFLEAFSFGTTREDADDIARLVTDGKKTSTGSLKWVYDLEGSPVPKAGDLSIVVDGKKRPVCIIEVTDVRTVPFNAVDEQFAWEGGEGDRRLESWRRIYWAFIKTECARIKRRPSPTTPMVCERFRVIYKARPRKSD